MEFVRRIVFGTMCIAALTTVSGTVSAQSAVSTALAPSYTFVDGRPPKQLKSGFESLMITNCAYGSRRVGDNDLSADFAAMLKGMLDERFGNRLAGKVVSLEGFTVHLNNAAALRKQVGSMYSGLIPNLMNKREKVGCEGDDLRGGYELGEIEPAGAAPIVAAIQVKVGGDLFYARAITPATLAALPTKKASQELRDEWDRVVDSLARSALSQLGDKIDQQLLGASPTTESATGGPQPPTPGPAAGVAPAAPDAPAPLKAGN